MADDYQLLRRFADERSESAFGELVTRHLPLVYSVALRQGGGDSHLAQDVAQMVFSDLVRKAPSLSENVILAGWLHRGAIFATKQALRGERRRRHREQRAATMNAIQSESESTDWQQIRPILDEALDRLDKTDRDALLLRFFEQQSLAQIGTTLGATEDAARKRIARALEKLHAILQKRGITTTAAALAATISANAIQTVPAGMAATLTTASLAVGTCTTLTLLKIMTATQLKLGIGALALAGAVTVCIVSHQAQVRLREQNQSLQQQIAQLQSDNSNISNRLAEAANIKKLSADQFDELLRLRGEVGVLRRQTNQLAQLQNEVSQLQDDPSTNQMTAQDKFILRQSYITQAMGVLTTAIKSYTQSNNGAYPTDFSQLNLPTNQFDGGVTLNDFEFINATNHEGERLVIRARNLIPSPDGRWIVVYGSSNSTQSYNVENPDAGPYDNQ